MSAHRILYDLDNAIGGSGIFRDTQLVMGTTMISLAAASGRPTADDDLGGNAGSGPNFSATDSSVWGVSFLLPGDFDESSDDLRLRVLGYTVAAGSGVTMLLETLTYIDGTSLDDTDIAISSSVALGAVGAYKWYEWDLKRTSSFRSGVPFEPNSVLVCGFGLSSNSGSPEVQIVGACLRYRSTYGHNNAADK